jgi:addiction module HigA family antidote
MTQPLTITVWLNHRVQERDARRPSGSVSSWRLSGAAGNEGEHAALALNVAATRLHEIVKERRGITVDTAYRLARYFDTTPEFWLNLQAMYDLKTLPKRSEIDRKVEPRESTRG